jgi:hypothetical protein
MPWWRFLLIGTIMGFIKGMQYLDTKCEVDKIKDEVEDLKQKIDRYIFQSYSIENAERRKNEVQADN